MPRDLLDAVDRFAVAQDDSPSRPEAIRRLLRDHLIGLSILPWSEDPEGANGRD